MFTVISGVLSGILILLLRIDMPVNWKV